MKTVQVIIERYGGLEALRQKPIRLQVEGFMRLVIEYVGEGPRGMPMVSVAHYFEQHVDLCCDPDMTFEIDADGRWHPVYFQQAVPPVYQEAVSVDKGGKVVVRKKILRDLQSFAAMWDRNLKEQGFADAMPEE